MSAQFSKKTLFSKLISGLVAGKSRASEGKNIKL